jgi:pimeloyl-ACP methyl ester carboxylesterase
VIDVSVCSPIRPPGGPNDAGVVFRLVYLALVQVLGWLEFLRDMLTGKDSAYGSQQISILCGDNAAARDPEVYWRQIQASRAAQPLFGPLATNIDPCGFWPTAPREEPTQIGNGVPALVVQSDGDPVTRYKHGRAMHRALTGSRMLTLRGWACTPSTPTTATPASTRGSTPTWRRE